jgi:hypothetical protein
MGLLLMCGIQVNKVHCPAKRYPVGSAGPLAPPRPSTVGVYFIQRDP